MLKGKFSKMIIGKIEAGDIRKQFSKPESWRNIFYYICVPLLIIQSMNILYLKRKEAKNERENVPPYEYLNIQNTKFPWGNGTTPLLESE